MKNYSFQDLKFTPRTWDNGVTARITFPNGYTASVVKGEHTYGGNRGLYEMAVMHNGELVYDTPVTNDVLGHLTEGDVTEHLNEIACLPPRNAKVGIDCL